MLFDLRGRGRRRTVQVIYVGLAVLMGGGLVLFGIGSSSSGGLFDAFSDNAQSGGSASESVDKRIKTQLAKVRANPKDADAYAQLAILRFQRAGIDGVAQDGSYTDAGKQRLALAAEAWERHLALEPKQPNLRAANLMVQAYQGLGQLPKAVRAKQLVTAAEKPPSSNLYQQLAALAYQARDDRLGDLASSRAVDLAPPDQRKALRTALQSYKTQVAAQASQGATTTTPTG
jgi:hypothetical protein